MKSLKIVNVKVIFNIEKPIVVLEVAGHGAIIRNPKQMLTDLQNSARALALNPNELSRGIEHVSPGFKADFISAIFDCVGAEVRGDISVLKAGDTYEITEFHPAITTKTHKLSGKVSVGDEVKAETDSVWVEGFLSIPLTDIDKIRRDVTKSMAQSMLSMFGLGDAPKIEIPSLGAFNDDNDDDDEDEDDDIDTATAKEGLGTKKRKTTKK